MANMQGAPSTQEEQKSALEQYGINLTEIAKSGKLDPVIGRDAEIRRVSQVLTRRTKNNPVLIGEPGVGKTAVVEGLAQRIVAGDVADSLKGKQLVALDLSALVAGAMYRGQFEERLKAVLKEINDADGQIITFVDELHILMGAGGGEGSVAASNMLKPMLARGELRLIGATTLNEYREFIEKDAALERRFQQVYVGEPSVEDTVAILRGLKGRYEAHHGVTIEDSALVAAASLSNRYITARQLPDKAIDLIDEARQPAQDGDRLGTRRDRHAPARVERMKLEEFALKKEKDDASKERLAQLRERLREQEAELEELQARWRAEKASLNRVGELRVAARRGQDRARPRPARRPLPGGVQASSTRPSRRIERELAEAEQAEQHPTAAHGQRAGHRATTSRRSSPRGPASRSTASPRARPRSCCTWRPSSAGGSSARRRPCRRWRMRCAAPARASPTPTARPDRSCSSARPASARPSSRRRSPRSSSTTRRRWCAST